MSIILIDSILSSDTIVPDLCQSAIQEIQRNDITHTNKKINKNVILVMHILVCTNYDLI